MRLLLKRSELRVARELRELDRLPYPAPSMYSAGFRAGVIAALGWILDSESRERPGKIAREEHA